MLVSHAATPTKRTCGASGDNEAELQDDFTFAWNNEDHANAVLNLVIDELEEGDAACPPRGTFRESTISRARPRIYT
jgi:hypothetical protein